MVIPFGAESGYQLKSAAASYFDPCENRRKRLKKPAKARTTRALDGLRGRMLFGTFCLNRQKVQDKLPEAPAKIHLSETMKHSNSEDELFGTFCRNLQKVQEKMPEAPA